MIPAGHADRAMGTTCAVHHHRELVPLEVHHIVPLGDGGPNVAANRTTVCSNGHSSIHDLIDHCRKAGSWDALPWAVRRRYGLRVRKLARQGWDGIQALRRADGR